MLLGCAGLKLSAKNCCRPGGPPIQGELAGFNPGKGEKLSKSKAYCLARLCLAVAYFLSNSGVESSVVTPLYISSTPFGLFSIFLSRVFPPTPLILFGSSSSSSHGQVQFCPSAETINLACDFCTRVKRRFPRPPGGFSGGGAFVCSRRYHCYVGSDFIGNNSAAAAVGASEVRRAKVA